MKWLEKERKEKKDISFKMRLCNLYGHKCNRRKSKEDLSLLRTGSVMAVKQQYVSKVCWHYLTLAIISCIRLQNLWVYWTKQSCFLFLWIHILVFKKKNVLFLQKFYSLTLKQHQLLVSVKESNCVMHQEATGSEWFIMSGRMGLFVEQKPQYWRWQQSQIRAALFTEPATNPRLGD